MLHIYCYWLDNAGLRSSKVNCPNLGRDEQFDNLGVRMVLEYVYCIFISNVILSGLEQYISKCLILLI